MAKRVKNIGLALDKKTRRQLLQDRKELTAYIKGFGSGIKWAKERLERE